MKPKTKENNRLEEVIKQLIEEKGEETRALQKILRYIRREDEPVKNDNKNE